MSANILLDGTGKIASQFLPPSTLPTNPVFAGLTISDPATTQASITLETIAGEPNGMLISKNPDGSATLSQEIAEGTYMSFISTDATGNTTTILGQTTVNIGSTTAPNPVVSVLGDPGLGQIYDVRYNPAVRQFENPAPLNWALSIQNNGAGTNIPINIDFTPYRTGYYILTNTLGIISGAALNIQIDPAGIVEGYVSVSPSGGPTGNFVAGSGFIWNCSLGERASSFTGAIDPLEWTQNCIFKLTEGVQYNIYIAGYRNTAAPTGVFNLACFGDLVQLC